MNSATGTNINFNSQYCYHRLPGGYCQILNRACPMYIQPVITPQWDITCQGSTSPSTVGGIHSESATGSDSVDMSDYPKGCKVTAWNGEDKK